MEKKRKTQSAERRLVAVRTNRRRQGDWRKGWSEGLPVQIPLRPCLSLCLWARLFIHVVSYESDWMSAVGGRGRLPPIGCQASATLPTPTGQLRLHSSVLAVVVE